MSQRSPVPTVLVIDDDANMRRAIAELLKSEGLAAETFASAQEFLGRTRPAGPSCLVLDLRLPGMDGLAVQRALVHEGVVIPIIFISAQGDVPSSVQAMKSGAVEFLTKPFDPDALLGAIHQALERDREWSVQQRELEVLREHYASLTAREREVMALVVSGLINKQVAAELGTSEVTVKIHRGHVMQKMQADSFADLVRMASKLQLPHTKG